jgi:hypothetical protein
MGAYSSRARAYRKRKNLPLQSLTGQQDAKPKSEPKLSPKKRIGKFIVVRPRSARNFRTRMGLRRPIES